MKTGKLTSKQVETEKFIDEFTSKNGYPPAYKDIREKFNIGENTAYFRCRNLRHKMRTNTKQLPVWEMLHGLAHAGKQAKRAVIKNDTYLMIYNRELVQMCASTGVRYPYVLTNDDLMANDWQFRTKFHSDKPARKKVFVSKN